MHNGMPIESTIGHFWQCSVLNKIIQFEDQQMFGTNNGWFIFILYLKILQKIQRFFGMAFNVAMICHVFTRTKQSHRRPQWDQRFRYSWICFWGVSQKNLNIFILDSPNGGFSIWKIKNNPKQTQVVYMRYMWGHGVQLKSNALAMALAASRPAFVHLDHRMLVELQGHRTKDHCSNTLKGPRV